MVNHTNVGGICRIGSSSSGGRRGYGQRIGGILDSKAKQKISTLRIPPKKALRRKDGIIYRGIRRSISGSHCCGLLLLIIILVVKVMMMIRVVQKLVVVESIVGRWLEKLKIPPLNHDQQVSGALVSPSLPSVVVSVLITQKYKLEKRILVWSHAGNQNPREGHEGEERIFLVTPHTSREEEKRRAKTKRERAREKCCRQVSRRPKRYLPGNFPPIQQSEELQSADQSLSVSVVVVSHRFSFSLSLSLSFSKKISRMCF